MTDRIQGEGFSMFYLFNGLRQDIALLKQWITRILSEEQNMATTLSELDSALASLTTIVGTVSTDVAKLVSDFQALQAQIAAGEDFTSELTSVNAAITSLSATVSAVQGADPTPTTPAAPTE